MAISSTDIKALQQQAKECILSSRQQMWECAHMRVQPANNTIQQIKIEAHHLGFTKVGLKCGIVRYIPSNNQKMACWTIHHLQVFPSKYISRHMCHGGFPAIFDQRCGEITSQGTFSRPWSLADTKIRHVKKKKHETHWTWRMKSPSWCYPYYQSRPTCFGTLCSWPIRLECPLCYLPTLGLIKWTPDPIPANAESPSIIFFSEDQGFQISGQLHMLQASVWKKWGIHLPSRRGTWWHPGSICVAVMARWHPYCFCVAGVAQLSHTTLLTHNFVTHNSPRNNFLILFILIILHHLLCPFCFLRAFSTTVSDHRKKLTYGVIRFFSLWSANKPGKKNMSRETVQFMTSYTCLKMFQ